MTTWHADTDTIAAYATGEIDDARAFSVEAHLLTCPDCRETCARMMTTDHLGSVWSGIVDTIDRPSPRLAERAMRALGVQEHVARLIGATPSLQVSWLLAIAATLAFAVLASFAGRPGIEGSEPLVFLLIAPLIPLAGIAAAYGPGIDPTYEMGMAAPMSGSRLLLMRAVAVVGTSLALTAAAALALPGPGWAAAAWLLPALGLTVSSLALSTAFHPLTAAGALATLWVGGIITVERLAETPLASFQTEGQIAFFVVTAVGAMVVAARHDRFEQDPE